MRKRLKDHREVCHYWANKVQPHGACGNVFFEHEVIYSYGHHFPMAAFTGKETKGGAEIVLLTTRRYSVTTSGHVSMTHNSLPLSVHVLTVPYVLRSAGNDKENLDSFQERIDELIEKLTRARSGISWILEEIGGLEAGAVVYRDAFMDKSARLPVLPPDFFAIIAKAREREERKEEAGKVTRARHMEQYKERERLALLSLEEKIAAWREGKSVSLPYSAPTMLRLNGSTVETSHGARVPLDHAERVYCIVKRMRERGETFEANGKTIPVGVYKVDRIDADGTLHAGCHVISFEEISRFATERGWN